MPHKHLIKMLFHLSSMMVTFTLLSLHPQMAAAGTLPEEENRKSRLIDYMLLQSGGYLGYIAVGVGKDFGRHKINMMIGYIPENIAGVEVMQLDFKYDWHPSQAIPFGAPHENIWIDPFYIGISMIYGAHNDLFLDLPEQYPPEYYPSTALRYTLNIGASLQYDRHTFFIEYSALDVGLVTFINHPEFFIDNYDYFGLKGIGSLAIGVKFQFE